ncbi:MAG: TetR/AcrR family transcriptional regulator [Pseudomonadota bacterium]|jgi:AcrR family transcriptional regulator
MTGMSRSESPLVKLRREEKEVRKGLILDAATALFSRLPFDQVGMREIATEVGISPAAIYRYFSDRDELFVEVLCREVESVYDRLARVAEGGEPMLERLATAYVTCLTDNRALFQIMTYFMAGGEIRAERLERFNQIQRRLLDLFQRQFPGGHSAARSRLLAHALFASLNGVLISFLNYPGREAEERRSHVVRLAKAVAQVFAQGGR